MALALWAAAEPEPVAWAGLDEYDNAPEVFWSHVVAALPRAGVAVPGGVAGRVGAGRRARVRAGAGGGAGGQDPPLTLVLDDLHLLTDPAVLDGLD